jgi:DNA end-binding protein Ku
LFVSDPYFVYPEKHGEEAYRVIAEALKNKDRVAVGRVVLSTREHPVMIEPFGDGGLLMSKLRAPDEVRQPEFDFKSTVDKQMIDLAETIMDRLAGEWNPSQFQDRYQEALRGLIDAKQKGQPLPKGAVAQQPTNVVDLMAVLKKSLLASSTNDNEKKAPPKKAKVDQRQRSMLLPVKGGGKATEAKAAEPAKAKRKKAS